MRLLESTYVLQTLIGWLKRGVSVLRAIGPYAAIELLLPGGSLMALGLWLLQRKARKDDRARGGLRSSANGINRRTRSLH
jgi:hypothetical protein